jgi:phage shock protein E
MFFSLYKKYKEKKKAKKIKKVLFLFFFFLLLLSFLFSLSFFFKDREEKEVFSSPKNFLSFIEKEEAIIIDIRTQEEYDAGHLENSLHIDFYSENFIEEIKKLDKKKAYALYCRTGNRSNSALLLMKEEGFQKIEHLQGGIVAWENENKKICKGKVC